MLMDGASGLVLDLAPSCQIRQLVTVGGEGEGDHAALLRDSLKDERPTIDRHFEAAAIAIPPQFLDEESFEIERGEVMPGSFGVQQWHDYP